MKEMESIYHSNPIPSLPRLFNSRRPLGDSMMAYTERMRDISKFRNDSALLGADPPPGGTLLEVQARHIPRTGPGPPGKGGEGKKKPQQYQKPRRPLSLDELIGRPAASGKKDELPIASVSRQKERRLSEPGGVLSSSTVSPAQRAHKEDDQRRIRISFVSAADLFDLVDFSLRSRKPRNDHIKLARAEDTFRLINEANFFRSIPARHRMRGAAAAAAAAVVTAEKEEEFDKASLFVHGTSSPRQSPPRDNNNNSGSDGGWGWQQEEDGEWARREIRKSVDPYDTDDEDEDQDPNTDPDADLDPIRQKHLLLLQPQKLRFRPKRAKRMKLHRSLLSAIPEDERHRRESQSEHAQDEVSFMRMPLMPTSSSLAAIKSSRKHGTERTSSTETKKFLHGFDANAGDGPLTDDTSLSDTQTNPGDQGQGRPWKDRHHQSKPVTSSQVGESHAALLSDPPLKKRHTPREDNLNSLSPKKTDSSRKAAVSGWKTSSQNGQSQGPLEAPNPRVRAQKKFRKLIFLRDQPDQFYHRYS